MAWIPAGAAVADTTNKTAKRCALLVEVQMNKIKFFFRIKFTFICLLMSVTVVE